MKKLIFIILTLAALGCKSPKNAVTGFSYDGAKACINGTVTVYAPTAATLDSVLRAISQGLVSFQHVSDSADAHTYKYILCSPVNNK